MTGERFSNGHDAIRYQAQINPCPKSSLRQFPAFTFGDDWSRRWLESLARPVQQQRQRIRALIRKLEPLSVVAQLEFFFLFLFGPVITIRWGLFVAIPVVLSVHLALSLIVLAIMVVRMRSKDITLPAGMSLWFECLVCPGYQANAFRRALLRQGPVDGDALALVRRSDSRVRFAPRLVQYAEELNEHGIVDDRQLAACRLLAGEAA